MMTYDQYRCELAYHINGIGVFNPISSTEHTSHFSFLHADDNESVVLPGFVFNLVVSCAGLAEF